MGTFANVTLGNGILSYGGQDQGFLKGDVQLMVNRDILDFETGVPLTLKGSITRKFGMQIKVPLAEIFSSATLGMMLGGLVADQAIPGHKTFNMGASYAIVTNELVFTHTNPQTNKQLVVTFWKARVSGKIDLKLSEQNFSINECTFDAIIDDVGHATAPFGTIAIVDPFVPGP